MFIEKKDNMSENNDGATSVVFGKHKPKSIKWSPENEVIMVEWCDIAQCYKWLHMRCHTKLSYRHAWFTIPAIALSTISGTASFAQTSLPLDTQVYAPMAIGTINILIGISTTIQQYLKISELNESHRVSGISWDKFARNIRIEIAKDPDERMDAGQFLKICRAEFDRLMETSPSIDAKTVKEFHDSFKGKETEEDRKKFQELQQERFKELRKPDICNIIISSNESRHHWYMDTQRLRNFTQSQFEEEPEDQESRRKNSHNNMTEESNEITNFSKHPERRFSILDSHLMSTQNSEDAVYSSANEEKIRILENIKIQKQQEQKEFEELVYKQTLILEEYVVAFVESLGRKPLSSEIVLNMKDEIDMRVIEQYLQTYDSEEISMV